MANENIVGAYRSRLLSRTAEPEDPIPIGFPPQPTHPNLSPSSVRIWHCQIRTRGFSHPSCHTPTDTSQVRTFLSTTPILLRKQGEIERNRDLFGLRTRPGSARGREDFPPQADTSQPTSPWPTPRIRFLSDSTHPKPAKPRPILKPCEASRLRFHRNNKIAIFP